MTQTETERERYESRLKWQRDIATALAEAAQKGEQKGEQKARKALVHEIHFCQRMLRRPQTPEDQLQSLAIEHLEKLVQELEEELAPKVTLGV
jgi:flagellar biosynthesis/type III secretory pathway protein FliH